METIKKDTEPEVLLPVRIEDLPAIHKNEPLSLYYDRIAPVCVREILRIATDKQTIDSTKLKAWFGLMDLLRDARDVIDVTPRTDLRDKTDEEVAQSVVDDSPRIAELIAEKWSTANPEWVKKRLGKGKA